MVSKDSTDHQVTTKLIPEALPAATHLPDRRTKVKSASSPASREVADKDTDERVSLFRKQLFRHFADRKHLVQEALDQFDNLKIEWAEQADTEQLAENLGSGEGA